MLWVNVRRRAVKRDEYFLLPFALIADRVFVVMTKYKEI